MTTTPYFSDDYAGFEAGKYSFYFGYEQTACPKHGAKKCECEGAEWAFVAKLYKRELMRIPQSQLGVRDGSDMLEYLLTGVALCIEEHMQ